MEVARVWRQQPALLKLIGTVCVRCGGKHYPARRRCPACGCLDLDPLPLPRRGRVASYALVHEAPADFRREVPFVAALVELEGGPMLATTLTDVPPGEVTIGMEVEMVTRRVRDDGEDGPIIYGHKFRPSLVPRPVEASEAARPIASAAMRAPSEAAPARSENPVLPPVAAVAVAQPADGANLVRFSMIPYDERALFLPHCLRDPRDCPAPVGPDGYDCVECGRCSIAQIKREAEGLGYKVFIVPGGSLVERIIRAHAPRAVVGIACHVELAEALDRCRLAGLPALGVPLLKDGCVATEADLPAAITTLRLRTEGTDLDSRVPETLARELLAASRQAGRAPPPSPAIEP